jgi:hypothetical protein
MLATIAAFAFGVSLPVFYLIGFAIIINPDPHPLGLIAALPLAVIAAFLPTLVFAAIAGTSERWRRMPAGRAAMIAGGLGVVHAIVGTVGTAILPPQFMLTLVNTGWGILIRLLNLLVPVALGFTARALAR